MQLQSHKYENHTLEAKLYKNKCFRSAQSKAVPFSQQREWKWFIHELELAAQTWRARLPRRSKLEAFSPALVHDCVVRLENPRLTWRQQQLTTTTAAAAYERTKNERNFTLSLDKSWLSLTFPQTRSTVNLATQPSAVGFIYSSDASSPSSLPHFQYFIGLPRNPSLEINA